MLVNDQIIRGIGNKEATVTGVDRDTQGESGLKYPDLRVSFALCPDSPRVYRSTPKDGMFQVTILLNVKIPTVETMTTILRS